MFNDLFFQDILGMLAPINHSRF